MKVKTLRRRSVLFAMLGILGLGILLWFIAITPQVVSPEQDDPNITDSAIISLAPQYNRLPYAQHLSQNDNAGPLVLSYFDHDEVRGPTPVAATIPVTEYCEPPQDSSVICFTPEKVSTLGEALEIRELARQYEWTAITVVTSEYHVHRTRYIFEQCLTPAVDVAVLSEPADMNPARWAWHIVYENFALLKAIVETNGYC